MKSTTKPTIYLIAHTLKFMIRLCALANKVIKRILLFCIKQYQIMYVNLARSIDKIVESSQRTKTRYSNADSLLIRTVLPTALATTMCYYM